MNWIWPNTYFYIENRGWPFWLSLRMIIVKFTNKRSKTYGLADWKRALHDRNDKILTQYSHHSRFHVLSWQRQQVTGVWWLLTLCFYQLWSRITHQILYLFRKYIIFIIISYSSAHHLQHYKFIFYMSMCLWMVPVSYNHAAKHIPYYMPIQGYYWIHTYHCINTHIFMFVVPVLYIRAIWSLQPVVTSNKADSASSGSSLTGW